MRQSRQQALHYPRMLEDASTHDRFHRGERMDLTRVEVDGAQRKLVFHGDCAEMRSVCRALCCREWDVGISAEELASGLYEAETVCTLTDKACPEAAEPLPSRPCVNLRYRLRKREDRSCIHLQDERCSIYAARPRTCREFSCRGGWRLATVFPVTTVPAEGSPSSAGAPSAGQVSALTKEAFVERLRDDMTFVLHPLLKVHTVFYLKQRREVVFVKQMVGACGKFNSRDSLDLPQLDDAGLMALIDLFGRKETLGQIHRSFLARGGGEESARDGDRETALTLPELFELVWLLNKHSIVLDSRNFKGMLGGIGAIG